ncbi:MAG: alpha-L-fucosidase [Akkermansiaceae bacterium]|jgi:alpha-L-fucosidase|nr:alpha-L-fucosidase [Akkermansiaceae bacterium]
MKLPSILHIAAAAMFSSSSLAHAETRTETKAEFDQRMEWFREARFGMFIHWGLYSVPAGEWKGQKFDSNVEWIQSHAQIPVAEYTPLKDRFNPAKYDPEACVKLAKDAGMKYIVITTKHHDGFCLWDSKQTDWDIASTPYGKDLLKPLAAACAKHGIKLCFYHSIMDWHHPQWGTKAAWRGNAATDKPDMDLFTTYLKAQLKELLTDYGDVGILWFDGEWEDAWTHERGKDLYAWLRDLSPRLIINNRVDKGRDGMAGMSKDEKYVGDYGTPEQEIPANGLPGVDWESCMTMNETWGFSAHDKHWKSTETLVRNLIDIASKGGNYLLNVGPTAEGEIPAASIERLQAIAPWMKANGEAIHGTQASPFPRIPAWGRCTTRPLPGGKTRLYLHVFQWPADGRLVLTGLTNPALGASLLTAPSQSLDIKSDERGTIVQLPANAPDALASVVVLDVTGTPVIEPFVASAGADGIIALPAADATLEGHGLKLENKNGASHIGYWTNPADSVSFRVRFEKAGGHDVSIDWACPAAATGSKTEFRLFDKNNQQVATLPWTVTATGSWETFQSTNIGTLQVPAAGNFTLRLVALDKPGEGVANVKAIRLTASK